MGKRKKFGPGDIIGETRRVLGIGRSHYISLPPEFVKLFNIKRGDRLPVAATQESMKIIPLSEPHWPEPELEPEPKEPEQKIRCPLCHRKILLSSYTSHMANYCPKALALRS